MQAETNSPRQLLPWQHGALNLLQLLGLHGALLAWLWAGRGLVPWAAFLPLSVFACLLHQRQLSEWYHEATHWNLFPGHRWNDLCANLLIAPLNGVPVSGNRPGHFRHHAVSAFFGPDDPDTRAAAARTRQELRAGLLRDVAGITAWRAFRDASQAGTSPARRAGWFVLLAALHAGGLLACLSAGRVDIYPLYFGTLLTLYPIANRLRLYAQHAQFDAAGAPLLAGSSASRSFHSGLLERLILHSQVIVYHHEHHAAPSLPFRELRARSRASADPNVHGTSGFACVAQVLRGLPP